MLHDLHPQSHRVLIAGGGVAALEAALAIDAMGEGRVETTLLTSSTDYVVRAAAIGEPFGFSAPRRHDIGEVLGGALRHVPEDVESVSASGRLVTTTSGTTLQYDALIVACGARPAVRFPYAITVDDRKLDALMRSTIRDIESGLISSIAFVAPERMGWPLPLYELALLTHEQASAAGVPLDIVIATPEDRPLEMFGDAASRAIAELLAECRIDLFTSVYAEAPKRRQLTMNPGDRRVNIDRIVALPELYGPAVPGLPSDAHGFLPIDPFCRVRNAGPVFAVGDCSDFPIKHGGVAAQMAVTAARLLCSDAGAAVEPTPLMPELRGMLLTGRRPRYLRARAVGSHAEESRIAEFPLWSPPSKVSTEFLEPRLRAIERRTCASASAVAS